MGNFMSPHITIAKEIGIGIAIGIAIRKARLVTSRSRIQPLP